MRVFLFSTNNYLKEKVGQYLSYLTPFFISLGFLLAIPRFLNSATCTPLGGPYPHAAIMIVSFIDHDAKVTPLPMKIEVIINPFVLLTIAFLNIFMLLKLRQSKHLSTVTGRKHNSKAEKVLTFTMGLLTLPVLINISISLFEIFDEFHYFVFLIGPVLIDAQSLLITCYFYFTHPVFKKPHTIFVKSSGISKA
ncbi:hypothetical protein B9Z55_008840 [Caenorhabditis nigoni]|uniref:Uncharacterized protein n=2 Tax=Caenorhabditis nigoni TaxID=1611254 RepID=A0A2G5UPC4_9PELO|nr:hypothetical protein B9Z55_008840 [Caenorhabditis nigoni]